MLGWSLPICDGAGAEVACVSDCGLWSLMTATVRNSEARQSEDAGSLEAGYYARDRPNERIVKSYARKNQTQKIRNAETGWCWKTTVFLDPEDACVPGLDRSSRRGCSRLRLTQSPLLALPATHSQSTGR